MMIDLAVELANLIETTIVVDKVAVTAGSPAASDKCSAVYVWGSQIFHSPQPLQVAADDAGCFYRRAYELRYRIDVCRTVTQNERTEAQQLAEATRLYDYADEVWCAITSNASAGSLFTDSDCESVTVGALEIGDPLGDRVSAEGYVRVTYPCLPGS